MAYDFDKVARGYDRMNHLMTLGLDKWWRRRGTRAACPRNVADRQPAYQVLDVACGTGDMCLLLAKQGATVAGVDLSEEMLAIARNKTAGWQPAYQVADAEALPFADGTFDAVTCAYGVRNFVHLDKGLGEMLRVLKPGGRLVVLEMATPDNRVMNVFYKIYARHIIPWLGSWLAGNREAYTYLPASIERFPKGQAFLDILQNSKFKIQNCREQRLTFGVCRLYTATKQ